VTDVVPPDLLALTAELVDIPSVSRDERALADHLEARLRALPHLDVTRHLDNVVARTELGRASRLLLAGHTDTVPVNGNAGARVEGDVLHGLGSSDMKAGVAVALALAEAIPEPAIDVTWVFYAGEEIEAAANGLGHLFRDRPELVAADAAVVGEPTDGLVEGGCQGTLRLAVTLAGARAHTARPWKGVNAIHRLGEVLRVVSTYEPRCPVLDGCEFREALQAVSVEGGVAGNVVPDRAVLHLNHRFAPDRTPEEAEAAVRELLAPTLSAGDEVELLDSAPGALPGLAHPLLAALVERSGAPVRAKLGWTDVARIAAHGIPACNFGPGDPTLAHHRDERVARDPIEGCYRALAEVLTAGASR
jgi:succinyl-diaminopimelate desuccinylase